MHQDGGDYLRVLALDQLRHGLRIDPFEPFDAACILALQDAADVVGGLVFAQSPLQYGAGIAFGIKVQKKRLGNDTAAKIAEHRINLSHAQVFQFCHRCAKFLHLQLTQVLQYLHSLFLAQRQKQHRAFVYALLIHGRPPIA